MRLHRLRRYAAQCFLLVNMICLSSCINQLLNVARSPAAVADAVAGQTAQQLVGDDLATVFSDTATADSIDRALKENPDALNGNELRQLRDELEAHNMGSNDVPVSSSKRKKQFYERRVEEELEYPYRVDRQTGILYDEREFGRLDAPRVPLQREIPRDRLLRSRDEWRFGQPEQQNLRYRTTPKHLHHKKFQPKIMTLEEYQALQLESVQR